MSEDKESGTEDESDSSISFTDIEDAEEKSSDELLEEPPVDVDDTPSDDLALDNTTDVTELDDPEEPQVPTLAEGAEELSEFTETPEDDSFEEDLNHDRDQIGISDTRAAELMREDYRDFHKGVLENSEVVEEYDLDDHSKVQILFNPYINEHLYRVLEPELTELEEKLRMRVSRDIQEDFETLPVEEMGPERMKEEVVKLAKHHLERQRTFLGTYGNQTIEKINETSDKIAERLQDSERFSNEEWSQKLDEFELDRFDEITEDNISNVLYYITRDYAEYEKLSPIMKDKYIEDVSCNGPEIPIFLYHSEYHDIISNVMYGEDELDDFVAALAQKCEKHISIAEPDMQGRLPDGSRAQLTYSDEISSVGSNFTLRKFKDEPFTPVELIEFDTFSLEQMAYLWLAIENDKSLIFAGGTASGKTTSMNAISLFIPPRTKVITIEDTREITLRHSNWLRSTTRDSFGSGDSGEVDMYQLLRNALRQRPEYIIVGEIRGAEAQTLFQAMSTGHTTYSTMHADDATSAIRRLENDPINLPRQMLNSLDILSVQIRTMSDGEVVRRCKEMVEIVGIKSETEEIQSQVVFEYNPATDKVEYKGDSEVMRNIQRLKNWSDDELEEELERRIGVLRYLRDEVETRDYNVIAGVLRTYMQDKEIILTQVENGTLLEGQ